MALDNITYVDSNSFQQTAQLSKNVLDKDDFLRLLVTKLSYQDPLNPIADEDFVAQLAQFAALEQMENMNDNLTEDLQWNYLLSQTISNTMSTSLIGREVRADSSHLKLDTGGSTDILLNLQESTARLDLTIYNESGDIVRTITVDNPGRGDIEVEWDGLSDAGVQCPAGIYRVEASAVDFNGDEFEPGMYVQGKVEGVSYFDGVAFLNIKGQSVPLGAVREVKEG